MVLFAFLDAYFLRPLPIAGAQQHVELEVRDEKGQARSSWPLAEAEQVLAARSGLFERGYLFSARRVLVGTNDLQRAYVEVVSPSYFDLVRPRLAMGRVLQATSEGGPEHAVLLSWFGWKRLAGGDPKILGKALVVDGVPLTVAGVPPEGWRAGAGDAAPLGCSPGRASAGGGARRATVAGVCAPRLEGGCGCGPSPPRPPSDVRHRGEARHAEVCLLPRTTCCARAASYAHWRWP
jgi:hypothetical protein